MVLPFLLSTRPPRRKSTPGRSIPSSPAAKVIVLSAGNACTTNRVGRLKRFLLLVVVAMMVIGLMAGPAMAAPVNCLGVILTPPLLIHSHIHPHQVLSFSSFDDLTSHNLLLQIGTKGKPS